MDRRAFIQGTLTTTAAVAVAGSSETAVASGAPLSQMAWEFEGGIPEKVLQILDEAGDVSRERWFRVDRYGVFEGRTPSHSYTWHSDGDTFYGFESFRTVAEVRRRIGTSEPKEGLSRLVEINFVAGEERLVTWLPSEQASKLGLYMLFYRSRYPSMVWELPTAG